MFLPGLPFAYRIRNNSWGLVEIRKYGAWGFICSDGFDDAAAKVVCKSQNFLGGIK